MTYKASSDNATLASNFQTFLTLLTTQLKNQNPLEPLDSNQFTQQLVQFAGVEQQMKMNTQMESLIAIEKTAQSTAAMSYLGSTATIDGATNSLNGGKATWTFNSPKVSSAAITIKDATGNTGLLGDLHGQRRPAGLQLGRTRQQRHQVARRQIHDVDHRQGRERAERRDHHRSVRHGRQRRPLDLAPDARDRRPELTPPTR